MEYNYYIEESNKYFCDIINDNNINDDFRYKSIINLHNSSIFDKTNHLLKIYISFCKNETNHIYYRILSSQYIFRNTEKVLKHSTQFKIYYWIYVIVNF